ncbi:hypothetical protein F4859DRAFT_482652 [Xylaria cf. heliscus]|nr:hypothetical protein F4859DRAFT_482652 [Xylaria cf. heliscus]
MLGVMVVLDIGRWRGNLEVVRTPNCHPLGIKGQGSKMGMTNLVGGDSVWPSQFALMIIWFGLRCSEVMKQKHTTPGIRWSSPTQLLIWRYLA